MNAPLPPPPDELLLEGSPPRATWRWWEAAAITLLGFVLGTIVSVPVFLALGGDTGGRIDGPGAAAAAVAYLVLIATLVVWLQLAHKGWRRTIGWPPRGERLREAGIGVGWGLASQVGVTVLALLVASVLAVFSGSHVEVPAQVDTSLTGWAAVSLFVYAVVVAPPTEELVFRGLLFHAVADRQGFWAGALASAIPFGFIHVIPGAAALGVSVLVFTMMINGLLWAWIHWRHRNLLVNIAAHAAFNAVGVLVTLKIWGS
jgi:membrane protease YdiL (CAAX protease family)